ncbi:MAG: hypothetical protein P8175_09550 [Deltaproteobacteria bacterium]|jgi:hypothetical protein
MVNEEVRRMVFAKTADQGIKDSRDCTRIDAGKGVQLARWMSRFHLG